MKTQLEQVTSESDLLFCLICFETKQILQYCGEVFCFCKRCSFQAVKDLLNSYFISHGSKFRGRPLTTLPVVLNKDLTRVSDDKLQLTSLKDLEHLRSVAQIRQTWRKPTTRIREAAKASPSMTETRKALSQVSQKIYPCQFSIKLALLMLILIYKSCRY